MGIDRNKMMENIMNMKACLEYTMEAVPCMVKLFRRFYDQAVEEGFTKRQAMEVAVFFYPDGRDGGDEEPDDDDNGDSSDSTTSDTDLDAHEGD